MRLPWGEEMNNLAAPATARSVTLLADPHHPVIRMHAQEGAALVGRLPLHPFDLERLDAGDFHGVVSPKVIMSRSAIVRMKPL